MRSASLRSVGSGRVGLEFLGFSGAVTLQQVQPRILFQRSAHQFLCGFPPSPKTVCGPSQLSATAVVAADMPAICLVSISGFLVGSPEGQVVSQQLHNQRRVLVRILSHIVKLCNGILEGQV